MSRTKDVGALLKTLSAGVAREITSTPAVQRREGSFSVATLPITARTWHQISDVVAVVVDLKNSTRLGTGKWARSTASLYEASTGNVTRIFDHFGANFIAIQGDGAFALFWGDRRYERAMCASITTQRFSADLVTQLQARWPDQPKTGLKIGIASGRVLAKRVGIPRNPAAQEPVWAGKPVNYATKAAQSAITPSIVVTASVWRKIAANTYLTRVCACSRKAERNAWQQVTIRRLPDGDADAKGRRSTYRWCAEHIDADCQAVLAGAKQRPAASSTRAAAPSSTSATAGTRGAASRTAPTPAAQESSRPVRPKRTGR